jgi:hypothetical protein
MNASYRTRWRTAQFELFARVIRREGPLTGAPNENTWVNITKVPLRTVSTGAVVDRM